MSTSADLVSLTDVEIIELIQAQLSAALKDLRSLQAAMSAGSESEVNEHQTHS